MVAHTSGCCGFGAVAPPHSFTPLLTLAFPSVVLERLRKLTASHGPSHGRRVRAVSVVLVATVAAVVPAPAAAVLAPPTVATAMAAVRMRRAHLLVHLVHLVHLLVLELHLLRLPLRLLAPVGGHLVRVEVAQVRVGVVGARRALRRHHASVSNMRQRDNQTLLYAM
jgi:hypothetical protein